MFASNKGDTVLPVKSSTEFGPLYWVATKTDSQYYVKLANYGEDEQNVIIKIPKTKSGTLKMLAGSQYEGNLPYSVNLETKYTDIVQVEGNYTIKMPPWAIAVVAIE